MAMEHPSATCVVIAYNHARFVIEALDAAFSQTYASLKILIFDDASTDDTPGLINEYLDARDHSDVLFIAHANNKGLPATLNEAMGLVNSKYVAFISADDMQEPNRFEAQIDLLEELGDQCGYVYSDAHRIDESGLVLPQTFNEEISADFSPGEPLPSGDIFTSLINRYSLPAASLMFRVSALRSVGPYDEELDSEDYDMTLRISRNYQVAFLDDPLVSYRQTVGSLWDQNRSDLSRLMDQNRKILMKHQGVSPEIDAIIGCRLAAYAKALYLMGAEPLLVRRELIAALGDDHRLSTVAYIALTTLRVHGPSLKRIKGVARDIRVRRLRSAGTRGSLRDRFRSKRSFN